MIDVGEGHRSVGARLAALSEGFSGWLLVLCVAMLAWLALATAGRLPGVDVPQHVLVLQRMRDGPSEVHTIRWVVPYTLEFALALPFAAWLGPAEGIWIVTALSIALLPVGAATLATVLRKPPLFGIFGLTAAFSTTVAWGFVAQVLSAAFFAFSTAATIHYCRGPSAGRGLLLAGTLTLTYTAHSVGWVLALLQCWIILLVWLPRPTIRSLWPLVLGTATTLALYNAWILNKRRPWADGVPAAIYSGQEVGLAQRISELPLAFSEFGRTGGLLLPVLLLLVVFAAFVFLGYQHLLRALRRLHRLSARRSGTSAPPSLKRWLRRFGPSMAWASAVLGYFIVPLWVGGILMVYPRLMVFAAVLTPAAVPARATRGMRWLALFALLPSLWLISSARAEGIAFAERTRCLEVLAAQVRQGEALLQLWWDVPDRYRLPVELHLSAEVAARARGSIGKDFTDYGGNPVVYRSGFDRIVVPSNLIWDGNLYSHSEHGEEFTAWWVVAPGERIPSLLRGIFGHDESLQARVCGNYALVTDLSVEPGGKPARVFTPHRHPPGEACTLERHGMVQ